MAKNFFHSFVWHRASGSCSCPWYWGARDGGRLERPSHWSTRACYSGSSGGDNTAAEKRRSCMKRKVLVVDIGGTQVKLLMSPLVRRSFASGPQMRPKKWSRKSKTP